MDETTRTEAKVPRERGAELRPTSRASLDAFLERSDAVLAEYDKTIRIKPTRSEAPS